MKFREILQTQVKHFIVSFISPVLSSVCYEVQHIFSALGVVRNDFYLGEDIYHSRTEVCNTMLIILVLGFCALVARTPGGFRVNCF